MSTGSGVEKALHLKNLIPEKWVLDHRILPFGNSDSVHIWFHENSTVDVVKLKVEKWVNKPVEWHRIDRDELERAIARNYGRIHVYDELSIEQFILEAYDLGGSDIHIEALESEGRMRIRVDGKLLERRKIPLGVYPKMINQLKILSKLDIGEKRLPQDGRCGFSARGESLDLRVSVIPSQFGEKAVIRILRKGGVRLDLDHMGFSDTDLKRFKDAINQLYGLVLITGPTGSGKTTTLYSALKSMNANEKNILTVEDPVEYTLQGITQVQLAEKIGLTFPRAMRSFLRQDPDVIMLGEVRDGETAEMAIRAALTGHLVLTTLHTNTAWGAVARLEDMGIPDFLIKSCIRMTVAQRLVRRLCDHCKTEDHRDWKEFATSRGLDIPEKSIKNAAGCGECLFTGYSGRIAVHEVIPFDDELLGQIGKNDAEIREVLTSKKVVGIKNKAWNLVIDGVTSVDEAWELLNIQ